MSKKPQKEVGIVLPTDVVFVARTEWGALDTTGKMTVIEPPARYVRLTDTGGIPCDTNSACFERVRKIQLEHTRYHSLADIGYNFIVSADGKVYEGRGWHFAGEPLPEVKNVYKQCIQVAFVGSYGVKEIPALAAVAVDNFLKYGIEANLLVPNFKLIGLKSPFIVAPYEEVKWDADPDDLGLHDLTNDDLLKNDAQ